ncbi:MAG: hypothetical protein ABW061_24680 [Polyangiaceae bacterium]
MPDDHAPRHIDDRLKRACEAAIEELRSDLTIVAAKEWTGRRRGAGQSSDVFLNEVARLRERNPVDVFRTHAFPARYLPT